ncbi:Zn-dependent hydrolase [Bacillus sp. OVS6]|uniref:Zn-dependent hydrolase n=1 Tax=Metabacillus dongyingensis TaxID=2874282 RepID=UPI001CBFBE6E|nr:Zn-dependent hydrolase [Metabacillus dongyingensis]UAL52250.1 Zn-dependent hydrolase [Metabacillus dongyingensis]UOK58024.1 Zn-dependent hydrolase [Bacillus sp. OVS6]
MAAIFSKERLLEELDQCPEFEGINSEELADKLSILADIGKTPDGGITRFPYTNEEKQAKSVFKEWMSEIGLDVREDAIGNLFGTLHGSSPDLPVVMTGSHLDSVPNGGAFDGPLGCLSSLLAIKAIASKQEKPKRSIELAVFVDEEGARFKNGIFGSRVMMGEVDAADFKSFKDDKGNVLYDEMVRCGHDPERVQDSYRNPEDIHAFLELHIEQGKRLESANKNIGIVSGIAGPSWTCFTFIGNTDHAGNTPMNFRRDTLAAAAEFILKVEQAPGRFSQTAVATVGKINVFPNGTNVISGKTEVIVDARDIDLAARDAMISALKDEAMNLSKVRGVTVDINDGINISPVIVPDHIQEVIQSSAEASGMTSLFLPSGAGHDAMTLGKYVPSGMIFVPSLNGKSHSPEEWTSLPDCIRGVQVLKESLARLANS